MFTTDCRPVLPTWIFRCHRRSLLLLLQCLLNQLKMNNTLLILFWRKPSNLLNSFTKMPLIGTFNIQPYSHLPHRQFSTDVCFWSIEAPMPRTYIHTHAHTHTHTHTHIQIHSSTLILIQIYIGNQNFIPPVLSILLTPHLPFCFSL